ncbi:DeoR/GlpR family DNA-binding transcription regulator, partial [Clostridium saudiense]
TNLTIASMIRNTTKNITVITNMNRILMEFDYSPNIEVISVGGTFNKRLGGTVGAYTVEQIKHFNIDKAFVGAGGVNIEENFLSNFNFDESIVKKEILKNSKKNYIVIDDEKFYKDGAHKFGTLEDVDYIITDKAPDDTVKVELDKYDVKVIY